MRDNIENKQISDVGDSNNNIRPKSVQDSSDSCIKITLDDPQEL